MTPLTSRKCSKTANKLIALVAVFFLILVALTLCALTASAAEWNTVATSPYVYYPVSGRIQNDNVNYEYVVDATPLYFGNVPQHGFYTYAAGPDEWIYGFHCHPHAEGYVTLRTSAFSMALMGSQYPSSLPKLDVTLSNVSSMPSKYYYEITYVFAAPKSDGTLSVNPNTYVYYIELPEFNLEEAYARFCSDDGDSPVFPSDYVAIITDITCSFSAVADLDIQYEYPNASDIFESFPNVEFAPPDVDVDKIIADAFREGEIKGRKEGFEEGQNSLKDFNPAHWILNILQAVFNFKILPIGEGITIGMIIAVLLVVPFAIWFLRLFAGG